MNWEIRIDICTLPCVKQLVGSCCIAQGVSSELCDELAQWKWKVVGGRSKMKGRYVDTQLTHLVVQQKTNIALQSSYTQIKKKKKVVEPRNNHLDEKESKGQTLKQNIWFVCGGKQEG